MNYLNGLMKIVRDIEKRAEITRNIGRAHEKQFQAIAEMNKRLMDNSNLHKAVQEAEDSFSRARQQVIQIVEQQRRALESLAPAIDFAKMIQDIKIPDFHARLEIESPDFSSQWFNDRFSHDDAQNDGSNEKTAGFVQNPSVSRRSKPRVKGFGK